MRVLEVLCAAGSDLRALCFDDNRSPMDIALRNNTTPCIRLLVANGVRLSSAGKLCRNRITPELWALERGVLCCRAAVLALLGLKRRRGDVLCNLDRWVVREVCFAVWATRTDKTWQ